MPLDLVKSNRGKDKLVLDSCFHFSYYETEHEIRWRCEKYRTENGSSKRRLVSQNGDVTDVIGVHNHTADATSVKRTKFINVVLSRGETSRQIVAKKAAPYQRSCSCKYYISLQNTARNVRRHRKTALGAPISPLNLRDLHIPEEYQLLDNRDTFLQYDSGPGENRTLIFTTNVDLQDISNSVNRPISRVTAHDRK